ncbi:LysE family transporter [Marinilongibacter aquaticus]|uniref:LysE family translocator n=1 Tax=Marinilongibacter aquaticus TaxID=2975157 RepID=UPI0021BDBD9B|nr:LysE family transporter [Marinilongibacter aquaticus]UBM59683.1 LysE family transporter [Marinilongibacter aquaticus]
MVWQALLYAIFTGFILSFGFGSVFFVLIQNSIEYGFKTGIKIASGVLFSDFLMVCVVFFGTSFLPEIPHIAEYSRALAAVFLVGMAVAQFRDSTPVTIVREFRIARFFYYFGKGFLLNILNPVNFLTWFFVFAAIQSFSLEQNEKISFVITCLFTIFFTECAIAYYSGKIKKWLNPRVMRAIKIFTATVFILLAIRLVWDIFYS